MTVSSASFLVSYPEFINDGTDLIDDVIAEVELVVADSWDSAAERDDIVQLKTADFLARRASGRNARKSNPDEPTPYAALLQQRYEVHACMLSRVL